MLAALVIIPAMATGAARSGWSRTIHLPASSDQSHARKNNCYYLFLPSFWPGMSSLMNLYEAPIATVQEKTGLGRKASCLVIAAIGIVISLLIQGIVSDWMDVLSIYICPLGAGLAGIMFFWVLGKRYVDKQVSTGREKPFTGLFFPISKYIYIPICFLVLILGIALGGIG